MADWKEYKLGEVSDILCGATPTTSVAEYWGNEIKWVTAKDVSESNGYKIFDTERKITKAGFENCSSKMLPANTTVLIARGATMGKSCMIGVEMALNQTCYALIAKPQFLDPYFLFYLVRDLTSHFINISHGAIFDTVIGSSLRETVVTIPDLPEQQAIAEVLSSLDNKIDLLHRQNNTLEALAETLFRRWFVAEVEESWDNRRLGDFFEIKHGYAFKGANIIADETDKILVTPGNFKIGGGFNFRKYKYFNSEDFPVSYVLDEGDFVVTMTDLSQDNDTLGYPAFIPEIKGKRLLHNQRVGKVLFRENHSDKRFFLYHLMKSAEYRHYVLGSSSGMAVAHTSPNSICGFEFNIPPDSLIRRFEEQARMFYEKERTNQKQIQTLTKLRDSLLPKLMSGEVRVRIDEAETVSAVQ